MTLGEEFGRNRYTTEWIYNKREKQMDDSEILYTDSGITQLSEVDKYTDDVVTKLRCWGERDSEEYEITNQAAAQIEYLYKALKGVRLMLINSHKRLKITNELIRTINNKNR